MRSISRSERFAALDRRVRRRLLLAFGFGAALVPAALVMALDEAEQPRLTAPPPAMGRPGDPLHAELSRCQALGEAGAHDPQCLAAWAQNRRRFLLPDHRVLGPNPAVTPAGAR